MRSFKVVLIDMRIPDGDGVSVSGWFARRTRDARTILITGYGRRPISSSHRSIAEGADAVCYKPFEIPELLETLGTIWPASAGGGRRGPQS